MPRSSDESSGANVELLQKDRKKSRIRETLNLLTDADSINIAMKRKKNERGDIKYINRYFLSKTIFYGGGQD